ncbi:MAG: TolC family protein [Pyrinomonadaceae bacterium]
MTRAEARRVAHKGAFVRAIRLSFVFVFVTTFGSAAAHARQQTSPPAGQTTTTTGQDQAGAQSGNSQQATPPAQTNQTSGQPGQTSGQGGAAGASSGASSGTSGGIVGGAVPARGVLGGGRALPGAAKLATGAPQTLSLDEAIRLALDNNLATLLARERKREAEGLRTESRAGLLPNISASAYQASVTENLAALGFQAGTFPGIATTFIGPFNNFDARARLVQNIFDLSAIRNYQAGRAGVRVAEAQEQLAREQVAAGVSLTYLEALRAERAVGAAQANVELAQTLLKLAQDQRDAGVATGVDVTRAETRLAAEQLRLAQAQFSSEQARLNLQRVVGLPLESPLTLTDILRFTDDAAPSTEAAVAQAGENRPEVRIAEAEIRVSELERKAISAEQLPSVAFVGDYGVSGITPTNTTLPTRRAAIQLNVPVFNGGLTRGRVAVAESRTRQTELELGNVRGQVEEDVRLALSGLRTAAQQVRAADESVRLSERELEMARDRFRAGVADNLEVVAAQTSLANSRDAQVNALTLYNAARLNLAAALGRAETFRW